MEQKFNVIADTPEEYKAKSGQIVKGQRLVLLDATIGVNRCTTQFEYTLSEPEKEKFAGKLQDKVITVGVREVVSFGNRMRIRGQIVDAAGIK